MAFGAPSKMKIRMKAKFYRGYIKPSTQNRSPTFDPNLEVLPGSQLEHSRRELQQQFERKSLPQVTKAWQNIYTKLNKTSQAPDALQLAMNHGDIIIMQGADVQKYYEVSISPHLFSKSNLYEAPSRKLRQHTLCSDRPSYQVGLGQFRSARKV